MSNIAKLNLTQYNVLRVCIEKDVIYAPSISNINTLDTNYTIVLNEGLPNEVTYSVGNGISLVDTPELKSIVWALDGTEYEKGTHEGYLKSQSNVAGTYLKIKIDLIVE